MLNEQQHWWWRGVGAMQPLPEQRNKHNTASFKDWFKSNVFEKLN